MIVLMRAAVYTGAQKAQEMTTVKATTKFMVGNKANGTYSSTHFSPPAYHSKLKYADFFVGGTKMHKPTSAFVENVRIFIELLRRDLIIIRREFFGDLINAITWPLANAITFGLVLPSFGMDRAYGSFLLIGALATTFFYLSVSLAEDLVNDFCGLRSIDFLVILPASRYWLILVQRVCSFAVHATVVSVPLIPIGKLLLGDRMDLSHFSTIKFMLIMLLSAMFYGFFALWLASWIPNSRHFMSVWRRVYTPSQLLGCYWFSFAMAYEVFGFKAYITLLNPLTYMCEGVRSAVLGGEKYLNFWLVLGLLAVYTGLFGIYAMRKLKRRLDLL
ncbi:ABC transporter permease [bacterium]|nr:ABC transporter permease [bacterium]